MPHTGVSAIMEGARLIDWANRVNEENRERASADNEL
jgi:acetylornithine deacetylase